MKLKFILAAVFVNLSFALGLDSLTGYKGNSVESNRSLDNLIVLTTSSKIRFVKNPCFNVVGYKLNSFRGFGFEDGVVKQFRNDGKISYVQKKYDNLYSFLSEKKFCSPISSKYPTVEQDIQSLEIW